jgi:predicted nucleotide-binding protein
MKKEVSGESSGLSSTAKFGIFIASLIAICGFIRYVITPRTVFLVHGQDYDLRDKVKEYIIMTTHCKVIILGDEPAGGNNIGDKFLNNAKETDYAVVLMTADNHRIEKDKEGNELKKPCCRENVIFELGAFKYKDKKHVAIIKDDDIEVFSDINGIEYYNRRNWEEKLREDLKNAGFNMKR